MAAKIPVNAVFLWCCRLLLGGTFIWASVLKIADPATFVTDVGHYHLLPHPLTLAIGVYLPWLELLCGIGVLCRWRERGALILVLGMCGVFFFALASAWFRGLDINCGCFGHSDVSSSLSLAIARAAGLGFLALLLLVKTGAKDAPTAIKSPSTPGLPD